MASAGQGIPTGFRPQIPSSAFPPPGSSYGLPQSQTAQQQQQRGGAGGAVNSGVTGAGGVGAGVPPFPPSRTGSTPAGGAQGSSNQLPPPGSGPGSQAAQAFLGQPNRSGTGGYPFSSTGGTYRGFFQLSVVRLGVWGRPGLKTRWLVGIQKALRREAIH